MKHVRHGIASERPLALPPPLRGPLAVVAALAALVLAVVAARYAGDSMPGRLDTWAKAAAEDRWPEPGIGTILIATIGDPLWVVVFTSLLTALFLALGRRRLAVVLVASMGMTGFVTTALKPLVGRTINGPFLAYPSGHTAAGTVLGLVVALLLVDLLRVGWLPGMLLILSGGGVAGVEMALSQVIIGTHYLTDTVGGFCTALVVVPAMAYLVDRLPEPRLPSVRRTGERPASPAARPSTP